MNRPDTRPERFSLRHVFIVSLALVIALGGSWYYINHRDRAPSASQQLSAAWRTFNNAWPALTSNNGIATAADDFGRLASAIGGIPFRAEDESQAHVVVQAAITAEEDFQASSWHPAVAAAKCPWDGSVDDQIQCEMNGVAVSAGVNWAPNTQQDQAKFARQIDVLFSDLGMNGPWGAKGRAGQSIENVLVSLRDRLTASDSRHPSSC